jgi:hypothetical protein
MTRYATYGLLFIVGFMSYVANSRCTMYKNQIDVIRGQQARLEGDVMVLQTTMGHLTTRLTALECPEPIGNPPEPPTAR